MTTKTSLSTYSVQLRPSCLAACVLVGLRPLLSILVRPELAYPSSGPSSNYLLTRRSPLVLSRSPQLLPPIPTPRIAFPVAIWTRPFLTLLMPPSSSSLLTTSPQNTTPRLASWNFRVLLSWRRPFIQMIEFLSPPHQRSLSCYGLFYYHINGYLRGARSWIFIYEPALIANIVFLFLAHMLMAYLSN